MSYIILSPKQVEFVLYNVGVSKSDLKKDLSGYNIFSCKDFLIHEPTWDCLDVGVRVTFSEKSTLNKDTFVLEKHLIDALLVKKMEVV